MYAKNVVVTDNWGSFGSLYRVFNSPSVYLHEGTGNQPIALNHMMPNFRSWCSVAPLVGQSCHSNLALVSVLLVIWCFTCTTDLSVVTHVRPCTHHQKTPIFQYVLALSLCPVCPHHALDRERATVIYHSCTYVLLGTILCSAELHSWLLHAGYMLSLMPLQWTMNVHIYVYMYFSEQWPYAEKAVFGTPVLWMWYGTSLGHVPHILCACLHAYMHMHVCAFMYDCLCVCVCVCVCVQVLVCMEFTSWQSAGLLTCSLGWWGPSVLILLC